MEITLPPDIQRFIDSKVAKGRYATPSDVIAHGLCLNSFLSGNYLVFYKPADSGASRRSSHNHTLANSAGTVSFYTELLCDQVEENPLDR